ncbi:MAG: 30S ribosomal protein S5 [Patescibacteria group bacterium]
MNKENPIVNTSSPVLEGAKSEKEIIARLDNREVQEYEQKVLDIARVTRVTKGGKRFTFRAAIIIGNKAGKVGFGIGKGADVAQSVEKAFKQAKKHLINVIFKDTSIPHRIEAKMNSAVVFLKPAPRGSGVRAGGPMRVIAKLAGIEDISGKIISKTNNKINIAKATIEALKKLRVKSS